MLRLALQRTNTILFRRQSQSAWRALSSSLPSHEVVGLPALSPTMESGNIADWKIEEGQAFGPGDVLCEVETDKATVDFEAQDDGVLAKILKPSGSQDIKVGAPVCIVVEDEDDVASFADYNVLDDVSSADDETPAVVASSDTVTEAVVTPSPSRDIEDQYILSPAARHLSQSKGLDATVLTGTGKGGRVTKGDVLLNLDSLPPLPVVSAVPPVAVAASVPVAAAAAAAAATPVYLSEAEVPEPAGSFEDVPNNNMRKVIAKRLTESKRDVPHFYTSVEIELDEVLALRKKLVNDHEVKVSVNDLIIKSSALALRDISAVNATYNDKKSEIVPSDDVDISVAVATPTGLITPIVTGADKRGLSSISSCVKDLATRARDGKLKPEEYQGGTFTISNLGMFGIDEFSAVINPPQAAILAVGGGSPRIIPTPYVEGAEEQEPPKVKTIMTARLSADRRVVDEATAAVFMKAFQEYLSKPHLLSL